MLFEPAAVHAVAQTGHGLPRKVNCIAHHVLLAAARAKAQLISAEHANASVEEVQ